MSDNVLPNGFESFTDARKNGFIQMKNLKDQGKKVAGTFCTYTPTEIFEAGGMVTVGLCSTSDETIADAETVLPRNLCPLIKSSYGFALTDKCPYMYFSDIVVGETTCDGKKKMYEYLGELKDVHVMQLPQTQKDEQSKKQWHDEVVRLKNIVEEKFDVRITDEKLEEAIAKRNTERRLIQQIYNCSQAFPPPISGLEQLKILYGVQFKFDYESKIKDLEDVLNSIQTTNENKTSTISPNQKRIVITGCPMGGVTEKVADIIEKNGGVVVAYENCTGAKKIENFVEENTGDPIQAIADAYLNIGCSVMSPDENRYALLTDLVQRFQADAVIEMNLQACHTYAIESKQVERICEDLSTPFLSIETDYSTSDIGQLSIRIGAFIEMLEQ